MAYTVKPPAYRIFQAWHSLKRCGEVYSDDCIEARVSLQSIGCGREQMQIHWRNISGEAIRVQLRAELQADFACRHYLIPGVSLNGNKWGRGKEPKGLTFRGEPWIFDSRRTTIPACTISEDEEHYLALMASDKDALSLRASCSLVRQEDGAMSHQLFYPMMEGPRTYCTRDGYTDPHEEWLSLAEGESICTTAFIVSGKPILTNFAAADVEDAALELLGAPFEPRFTAKQAAELCCCFALRLVTEVNGRKMLSIGQLPDENGSFENREGYEAGWCGQNGLYARLLLERGLRERDFKLTDIAVSNLDAWSHEAVGKTGLMHTHYHWFLQGRTNIEDTCNLGFAITELTKAWQLASRYGMNKADWLNAAKGAAEFLCNNWSDEYGFGKAWDVENGNCADTEGTIGAYIIPGLTALYRATNEAQWLSAARKACRFYVQRDLSHFQCTAGALDTHCIDKESGAPILAAALELYELDKSDEWLSDAKMAGWYFCSWMFHHDVPIAPESDFERYGYRTLGGTSVSAQHHHIDPWGAIVIPQLIQLFRITGDAHWQKRARLLWANAIQNISPAEGTLIHGFFRAAGAQNEGYHHCCWGEKQAPGFINDWLVAWPQAYCWLAANIEGEALNGNIPRETEEKV